jgi:hypothetical protein
LAVSPELVTTTTTNEVYRLALDTNTITDFADRATTDLATDTPVGSALASPDNLAIDHDGNIYIVEDRSGGVDDDIWFARDLNHDGDLDDAGERNRTVGVERHTRLGVHRSLLRPNQHAPCLGEHPTPGQRQQPHHRDHHPLITGPPLHKNQDRAWSPPAHERGDQRGSSKRYVAGPDRQRQAFGDVRTAEVAIAKVLHGLGHPAPADPRTRPVAHARRTRTHNPRI